MYCIIFHVCINISYRVNSYNYLVLWYCGTITPLFVYNSPCFCRHFTASAALGLRSNNDSNSNQKSLATNAADTSLVAYSSGKSIHTTIVNFNSIGNSRIAMHRTTPCMWRSSCSATESACCCCCCSTEEVFCTAVPACCSIRYAPHPLR